MTHISDHDLERFQLGMVKDEAQLSMIEGHLLTCYIASKLPAKQCNTWTRSGRESLREISIPDDLKLTA